MLPATTFVGIADKNPLSRRPTTTPVTDGTIAIMMQDMLYMAVLTIYSFLRPKASEYGGKTMLPIPWPMRYLRCQLGLSKGRMTHIGTKRKIETVLLMLNSSWEALAAADYRVSDVHTIS
jgi:hypothetical protein